LFAAVLSTYYWMWAFVLRKEIHGVTAREYLSGGCSDWCTYCVWGLICPTLSRG